MPLLSAERNVRKGAYRSFAEYIAKEAPPHYQPYYVSYAEGKELIKTLAALSLAPDYDDSILLVKGGSMRLSPGCPPTGFTARIRKTLQEAHQELMLRTNDPASAKNLCTQLLMHNMLGAETRKCNQFTALAYRRIEQAIRAVCVKLREVMEMDKQREAEQQQSLEKCQLNEQNDIQDDTLSSSSSSGNNNQTNNIKNNTRTDYELWRAEKLTEAEVALEAQAAEIAHLDMYTRINFKGLVRLASLYDKVLGMTTAPWTQANVMKEYFANVDIDSLLVLMSVAWRRWRSVDSRDYLTSGATSTWKPPESFIRNTTKYWVRPDQVVRTKLSILRHMPYLIFGVSDEQLDALVDPYGSSNCCAVDSVEEGQMVSSIYFDSETAWSYERRLLRLEGAQLVRFRWYGTNDGQDDKEIFIERKTHHEQWSGESSTKERFMLPQRFVERFMNGSLDIQKYAAEYATQGKKNMNDKKVQNILRLGHEIQDAILEHKLVPMVRTSYLRSAFQLSTRNDVRFSLDVNLCMVDERLRGPHPRDFWCRLGEEICGKDEVVRFPYAVLEVKLQAPQPPWVTDILADVGAVMVYKFSKFQHGMAFLHRPLVAHIGVPHWIPDFEREGFIPGFEQPGDAAQANNSHRASILSAAGPGLPSRLHERQRLLARIKRFARDMWRGAVATAHGGSMVLSHHRHETEESPSVLIMHEDELFMPPAPSQGAGGGLLSLPGPPSCLSCPPSYLSVTDAARVAPSELALLTLRWMKPLWSEPQDKDELLRLIYSRSKNIKRNDPKTFFAAERTLLHYMQKGLYLGGLATALLSLYDPVGSLIGLILGIAAIFVIAFSWWVFWSRCNRLNRRVTKTLEDDKERVDSTNGPIVLFAVLFSALIVALILNFSQTLSYTFGKRVPTIGSTPATSLIIKRPFNNKGQLLDVPALLKFLDRVFGNNKKVTRFFHRLAFVAQKGNSLIIPLLHGDQQSPSSR